MEHEERLKAALADRYQIEREIGSGGMAKVYLAHDLKHNRQVAVKVLDAELAHAVGTDRFLREIETAANLTHPHILPVHDSGDADGFLFFVMPFVKGDSLRSRLTKETRLSLEDAVRITRQIADALAYAHREGVIHRDVKPANIMLEEGHAVLADFGVAHAVAEARDERITRTGTSLGTPAYMSPEQATGDRELDDRSDQYALGCVVYEMLAGDPPFGRGSAQSVLSRVLTETPRRLEKLRDEIPGDVADAVHKALSRLPEDRFQRTIDFASALETALSVQVSGARPLRVRLMTAAATLALMAFLGWLVFGRRGPELAALQAVAETEEAIASTDWNSAYRSAMALPEEVEDSVRQRLLSEATILDTIRSEPPGARVSWRPLLEPEAPWEELGATPLTARLPRGNVLMRLAREGYATRMLWSSAAAESVIWPLRPIDGEFPDALFVPGGTVNPGVLAGGIWQGDSREVGDYLLDPFEVTNGEFKEFVDAGGYERMEFWEHPFTAEGHQLSWEQAMARFVDRTGRPGPSTWEIGDFPEGMRDYPVTGVSWYEASAYARFRERELPTLYHWFKAAHVRQGHNTVPLSNLEGEALAPVGEFPAVTLVGAYDMAGNAREWTANAAGEYRLTQGGGWADPGYAFSLAQPLSPFDRSEMNGIRLITNLGDSDVLSTAGGPVAYYERDFSEDRPVSDEVFEVFRDMYSYDDTPLNAAIEVTDTVQSGILRQRITFDAAYRGERMVLYLFLPAEERTEPLQLVFYFPGSGVLSQPRFTAAAGSRSRAGLTVRSGRAFAYPVIDGSFERLDDFVYPLQDESNSYRDRVIEWYQDVARALDYLGTRPDLDSEKIAFTGNSLGARVGAIMLALEPRFRTGVLTVAGLSPKPTQSVVDPFNFLPRVQVPVLVISGQFDPIYPLETSADPFFRELGSEVKEHYVTAGAHSVPWPEFAQQMLDWLDRFLGPVQ